VKKNLTYKDSGVNIEKSDEFVEFIKKNTEDQNENVISGVGGFASLFSIKNFNYKHPVIVSSTDGVGTKILIANETETYDYIGIDLVAMCVNDLLCHGAIPLFFLDYYATGKLNIEVSKKILSSIIKGCEIANIPLVGGETAEMPGLYQNNDSDLAGFAVGIVDKENILPANIKSGDKLIGIKSSGLHSNGFSLIRKLFDNLQVKYNSSSPWNNKKWFEILLEPTKIYVNEILKIKHLVKGIAHITGGGIIENVKRIIPSTLKINLNYITWPELFQWIMNEGNITQEEMLKTFNCGIGMVIVVSDENVSQVLNFFENNAFEIGDIINAL
jgi:phosphoribosylaminoimidazole synthetase